MEEKDNRRSRSESEAPQDKADMQKASAVDHSFENDFENDYPTAQRHDAVKKQTETHWDVRARSDADPWEAYKPNPYNANAGIGDDGSGGEHEGNYSDERQDPTKDYDSFDNEPTATKRKPEHPEF